ncbi:MAG: (2Fe-2S)-binding protein [Bacteroidales bacterium]|nr:MAG: (2Fe-2S)-binding protein [Bacteroidales bacterium]
MNIKIDGIRVDIPEGFTLLEAAKFLGIEIPTLCWHEGLSAWGGCRLCVVEIGEGERKKMVTSCTYPVEEGIVVHTASEKVVKSRKMILELLIAQCPTSRTLQDLASKMGVIQVRFDPKWENCIYCGLCVRICNEQMMARAIGFVNRGNKLEISTPFDKNSEDCRKCGGCIYICPACTLRCQGINQDNVLCNACYNSLQPTCISNEDNYNCWMGLKNECGTCSKEESKNI